MRLMRLAERPHDLKLTVPRCGLCHREVHAYRNWRGLVVSHRHVDVTTIVEIATAQGLFPLAHVIRDAPTSVMSWTSRPSFAG